MSHRRDSLASTSRHRGQTYRGQEPAFSNKSPASRARAYCSVNYRQMSEGVSLCACRGGNTPPLFFAALNEIAGTSQVTRHEALEMEIPPPCYGESR